MKLLALGGRYVLYRSVEPPQQIELWPVLSEGLNILSTAHDVRFFPMWRTAGVLHVVPQAVAHEIVSLSRIISHVEYFEDVAAVKSAVDQHSRADRMKTTVCM